MAKVMIVDDSSFMRQLLKNLLTKLGYKQIKEASGGKQALDEFKLFKPDLVLLDIILPDIGGEQVLSEIRALNKDCKIIMVTAVGQQPMVERCEKLGINGYIVKPFDNMKITELIKKVMA